MKLLFSMHGRIGRAEFWIAQVGVSVVAVILGTIGEIIVANFDPQVNPPNIGMLALLAVIMLAILPCIWATFAIGTKRCHDRGRTGWWQALGFIPIVNLWLLVELGCRPGIEQPNKWGPPAVPRDKPALAA